LLIAFIHTGPLVLNLIRKQVAAAANQKLVDENDILPIAFIHPGPSPCPKPISKQVVTTCK
jgi:hypothetical protein